MLCKHVSRISPFNLTICRTPIWFSRIIVNQKKKNTLLGNSILKRLVNQLQIICFLIMKKHLNKEYVFFFFFNVVGTCLKSNKKV